MSFKAPSSPNHAEISGKCSQSPELRPPVASRAGLSLARKRGVRRAKHCPAAGWGCSQECRRGCNSMHRLGAGVGTATHPLAMCIPQIPGLQPFPKAPWERRWAAPRSPRAFLSLFVASLGGCAVTNVSHAALCLFALAAPALGGSPFPTKGVLTRSAIFQHFGIPKQKALCVCLSSPEHGEESDLLTRADKRQFLADRNDHKILARCKLLPWQHHRSAGAGLGLIQESCADFHPLLI